MDFKKIIKNIYYNFLTFLLYYNYKFDISSLNVSKITYIPNYDIFYCSNNKIKKIPNSNLSYLYCQNNKIRKLKINNLKDINVSNNRLLEPIIVSKYTIIQNNIYNCDYYQLNYIKLNKFIYKNKKDIQNRILKINNIIIKSNNILIKVDKNQLIYF